MCIPCFTYGVPNPFFPQFCHVMRFAPVESLTCDLTDSMGKKKLCLSMCYTMYFFYYSGVTQINRLERESLFTTFVDLSVLSFFLSKVPLFRINVFSNILDLRVSLLRNSPFSLRASHFFFWADLLWSTGV